MTKFKVKSSHAEHLHDGEMVAPEDEVDVDPSLEGNKFLIDEGKLVPLDQSSGSLIDEPDDDETEEES